jgi:hypothetical protein
MSSVKRIRNIPLWCKTIGHRWGPWESCPLETSPDEMRRICKRCGKWEWSAPMTEHFNCRCCVVLL